MASTDGGANAYFGKVKSLLRSSIVLMMASLALAASPATGTTTSVVSQPVSFVVKNVNLSSVPCGTDGKNYVVRGHITGPAAALAQASTSGTLYLHGLELGEWFWRIPVAGYDHASEVAKDGHVSVTIDRLGYGASDQPAGTKSCVGGQATIAHQIVQQLRAGAYGGPVHPTFTRVALAGHSLGGSIAQVEAYSFKDVDAVAILSYADTALSASALTSAGSWAPVCLLGGRQSAQGAPGYTYFTRDQAAYRGSFLAQASSAVFAYADPRRALNPCGDLQSAVPAAAVSVLNDKKITVPVLLLMGDKDLVFDSSRLALQKPLYGGPTTMQIVPGATHGLTIDRNAAVFRSDVEAWLHANRF